MSQSGNIIAILTFHISHVISKSRRFSKKRVAHARYYFYNSLSNMGRGKNITEGEKALIIKEIARGKTNKSIDKRIIRHVVAVTKFLKNPHGGNLVLIAGI